MVERGTMTNFFKYAFLAGLILTQAIRFSHRARAPRPRPQGPVVVPQVKGYETLLLFLSFLGLYILPLVYIFSGWLEFANYALPVWAGGLGILLMILALYIIWRAHADLNKNEPPLQEGSESPRLVTGGIYRVLRHPIYTAMFLFAIAQALLIQNWIAGLLGALTFLPVYFIRVPREEKMMLERFGDQYREYMRHTSRILPKFFGQNQLK